MISPPETQATVAKYACRDENHYAHLFDSGQVAIAYFKATPQKPAFDTPHLFAINPSGMIVKEWCAERRSRAPGFMAELDQLIAGSTAKK